MACNGRCGRDCALVAAIDVLDFAVSMQAREYRYNRAQSIPYLDAIFQLHGYIRMGVCGRTATLPLEYMPNLEPLFRLLPSQFSFPIAHAITQALAQTAQTPSVLELRRQRRAEPY